MVKASIGVLHTNDRKNLQAMVEIVTAANDTSAEYAQ